MKLKRLEFKNEDAMNKFLEEEHERIMYIQGLEDDKFEVGIKDE